MNHKPASMDPASVAALATSQGVDSNPKGKGRDAFKSETLAAAQAAAGAAKEAAAACTKATEAHAKREYEETLQEFVDLSDDPLEKEEYKVELKAAKLKRLNELRGQVGPKPSAEAAPSSSSNPELPAGPAAGAVVTGKNEIREV